MVQLARHVYSSPTQQTNSQVNMSQQSSTTMQSQSCKSSPFFTLSETRRGLPSAWRKFGSDYEEVSDAPFLGSSSLRPVLRRVLVLNAWVVVSRRSSQRIV